MKFQVNTPHWLMNGITSFIFGFFISIGRWYAEAMEPRMPFKRSWNDFFKETDEKSGWGRRPKSNDKTVEYRNNGPPRWEMSA